MANRSAALYNDVWVSPDGASWTPVTAAAAWSKRSLSSCSPSHPLSVYPRFLSLFGLRPGGFLSVSYQLDRSRSSRSRMCCAHDSDGCCQSRQQRLWSEGALARHLTRGNYHVCDQVRLWYDAASIRHRRPGAPAKSDPNKAFAATQLCANLCLAPCLSSACTPPVRVWLWALHGPLLTVSASHLWQSTMFVIGGVTCRAGCSALDPSVPSCATMAHGTAARPECCATVSTCLESYFVNDVYSSSDHAKCVLHCCKPYPLPPILDANALTLLAHPRPSIA